MQGPSGWLIVANEIIIEGALGKLLVYNGTPATGNLIASVTGMAGTDPYSNTYEEGITAYVSTAGHLYTMQLGAVTVGATAYAGFFSQDLNAAPYIPCAVLGASSSTGSFVQLYSGLSDNAETAAIITLADSLGSGDPSGEILMSGDVTIQNNLTLDGTFTASGNTGFGGPGGTVTGGPNSGSFAGHTHDFLGHYHALS